MAISPKEGIYIYHITPIENLESIIINGLKPRNAVDNFINIADHEILQKRKEYKLEEYTPFHFFTGTPFCGSVQLNNRDKNFVYLALTRSLAEKMGCLIVPKHPINYDGLPLDWKTGFEAIDWKTMALRKYEDHNCKEVCMAEAIYKGSIKLELFSSIFVKDENTQTLVKTLLEKYEKSDIYVNISNMFVNHD